MNQFPCFRRDLRVARVGRDQVFLMGEQENFLIRGRLCAHIAPLLDGNHAVDDIIDELAGEISAPEIVYALLALEEKGYLAAPSAASPTESAIWSLLGGDGEPATRRLAQTAVAVKAFADLDAAPMIRTLGAMGVTVREKAPLAIVMTDDYLAESVAVALHRDLSPERHYLLMKPAGRIAWVGPLLGPDGACYTCLAQRLRANRPVEAFVRRQNGIAESSVRTCLTASPVVTAATQLAAVSLARWIVDTGRSAICDNLITLNLADMRLEHHTVPRRPQCPACGDPRIGPHNAAQRPLRLTARPKRYTADGGHRCLTPRDTYERLKAHVSPITGFVTKLMPLQSSKLALSPIWTAAHPVCPTSEAPDFDEFFVPSWGKGSTDIQAQVSALCEAIERRCAVFQGDEPQIRARFIDLAPQAFTPRALLGFSDRQYALREVLATRPRTGQQAGKQARPSTRQRQRRHAIPQPFDETATIAWTPVWSLTAGSHRYLPSQYCYAQYPADSEASTCPFDSNGNAAGNCLEEAIVQGFLELVERDCTAIWWYNRIRRPEIALDDFDQSYVPALRAFLQALGWRLWVLDITNDLDIPAFVALAAPADGTRLAIGFGCHLDAALGIKRALTELYQCFDPEDQRRLRQRPGWKHFTLSDHPYLLPDKNQPPRVASDYPRHWHDDLRDDVHLCVDRAANAGLETLVLDYTRPDMPLQAVKVMVPGLRHFWPRLGPGRLYQVPVALGWLAQPRTESQLNPLPVFW